MDDKEIAIKTSITAWVFAFLFCIPAVGEACATKQPGLFCAIFGVSVIVGICSFFAFLWTSDR